MKVIDVLSFIISIVITSVQKRMTRLFFSTVINYCETYIDWFVHRALNRAKPTTYQSHGSYAVTSIICETTKDYDMQFEIWIFIVAFTKELR